jgi:hypothetical protein
MSHGAKRKQTTNFKTYEEAGAFQPQNYAQHNKINHRKALARCQDLEDGPAARRAFWENGGSALFVNTLHSSWGGGRRAPPEVYQVKEGIVSIIIGTPPT